MLRSGITWSVVILTMALVISILADSYFPETQQFAIHWNYKGIADQFVGKNIALMLTPVLIVTMSLLMALIARYSSAVSNDSNPTLFLLGWIGSNILLLGVHIFILYAAQNAMSGSFDLNDNALKIIPIPLAIFFILLGNYLPKSSINHFVGVRTPWSLKDENSWYKSNRIAGFGFMLTGLMTLASLLFASGIVPTAILVTGAITTALISTWVSYQVYHKAQPSS